MPRFSLLDCIAGLLLVAVVLFFPLHLDCCSRPSLSCYPTIRRRLHLTTDGSRYSGQIDMALTMARPATSGGRPAYLDNLFRDHPPPLPKTPSLRSANSSISYNSAPSLEVRTVQPIPRPLSPAFEEDLSDRISLRSLKIHFSPRLKMRGMFNRRTYPQIQETMEAPSHRPKYSLSHHSARKPSLPQLQSTLTSPTRRGHPASAKSLPALPLPMAEELKCQPCYYFAARHCQGYVMGGSHGDACDNCAVCTVVNTSVEIQC